VRTFNGTALGLTLALAVLVFASGCKHTYKLNSGPITTWPEHEKRDASVGLVLTDDFCNYTYEKEMMGDRFIYPLGVPLANNAKATVERAFSQVSVERVGSAAGSGSAAAGDLIITPRVVGMTHGMSAWAFDPVDVSIDVEWKVTDSAGQVVWIKTVRGAARHHQGNMYTHKSNAKKRIDKVMVNLFGNSLIALTTAPELAERASR
jgi:hypothetical protein